MDKTAFIFIILFAIPK